MKLIKATILLAGALMLFFSCEQPLNDNTANSGPVPISAGESGTLKVSVPLISSALQSTLEEGSGDSRAYLFAKDVQIILKDSTGSEIKRTEASFPGGSLDNPGALLTAEISVPWGLNYTVLVQIQDDYGTVTVEGESAPFDMGFDQVSLALTLLPETPATLEEGPVTGSLAASVYDDSANSFSLMGDDKWFALTSAQAATTVLTVDTAGEALLFHADGSGAFVGSARGHDSSQPTVYTASLAAGETAYAGLIILNDTAGSADYTLNRQTLTGGALRLDLSGMAGEAGYPVTLELTPSGAEETAVTMTATLEGDGKSLYLFEADGLNLWQGTGTYDYTLYIDRDGSGSENRDDLVSRGSLTLEEGMNFLATSLTDFTLFAPDITGQWYSLNDETDLNPDYEVMEVVADITDEGAFTVYARRHVLPDEATDPNFSSNVPADEFLPLLEGTWSLNGYELTATIVRADILTLAVLTGDLDDAYYAQYDLGSVGLLTEGEINTLLTYAALLYPDLEINVDAEALAGIFDTYTQEVYDVNTTATGDGSAVTGYAATVELTYTTGETLSRTYTLLDSWLATDLGNEEFRAPLSFPE